MITPDMLHILSQTWTHLCTNVLLTRDPASTPARPAFVPLAPRAAVTILKQAACRTAETRVNSLAVTGDVVATRAACQVWARTVRTAVAAFLATAQEGDAHDSR